ncbi:hypothetical protein KAH27_02525, partial [bacterium]|nr:hypothetical protein [bacterium]
KNPKTGWHGYDFLVNRKIENKNFSVMEKYNSKLRKWENFCTVPCNYANNKVEILIPRFQLNLIKKTFAFDFHWADNPENLDSIIDFCTTGDSAPNRRFNYRCSFKPNKLKKEK